MTRKVEKDNEGLIIPKRPRRLDNSKLPRGGSNHMARLRRDLIQTYNTCVTSQRHVQEFFDLMLAMTKETKAFMADVQGYNEDRTALQKQINDRKDAAKAKRAELIELAADAEDPIVRVFSFTNKNELDNWAKGKGVELDARQSVENMKAVFIKEYKPKNPPENTTDKETK